MHTPLPASQTSSWKWFNYEPLAELFPFVVRYLTTNGNSTGCAYKSPLGLRYRRVRRTFARGSYIYDVYNAGNTHQPEKSRARQRGCELCVWHALGRINEFWGSPEVAGFFSTNQRTLRIILLLFLLDNLSELWLKGLNLCRGRVSEMAFHWLEGARLHSADRFRGRGWVLGIAGHLEV